LVHPMTQQWVGAIFVKIKSQYNIHLPLGVEHPCGDCVHSLHDDRDAGPWSLSRSMVGVHLETVLGCELRVFAVCSVSV
jgi:hypothetical protein